MMEFQAKPYQEVARSNLAERCLEVAGPSTT